MLLAAAAVAACSGDPKDLAPVRLTHTPAIGALKAEQLQALSLDCGKYPLRGSERGRYEAAYCEQAMAAWSDAPLQMLNLQSPARQSADAQNPKAEPGDVR